MAFKSSLVMSYVRQIDPDGKIPLDLNWKNNTKTVKEQMKDEAKKGGYLPMIKFALNPQ